MQSLGEIRHKRYIHVQRTELEKVLSADKGDNILLGKEATELELCLEAWRACEQKRGPFTGVGT